MPSNMTEPQPPAAPRSLGRIILRNTIAIIMGGSVMKALNFVFMIFTARVLSDIGIGQFASATAFTGLFSVFFELGLTQYFERSIARDRTRTQELFWNLVMLRLVLAVVGVVLITTLGAVMGYQGEGLLAIFLSSMTYVLAAFLMPLATLFSANERYDLVATNQVIGQIITLAVGTILLLSGAGFLALVINGFIAMPCQILLCLWAIRRYKLGSLKFQVDTSTWPAFARASLPFGITSLALTFNFNADTVILEQFHSSSEVGWYHVSYRLVFNLVSIAGAFLAVITPSLAREHTLDPERVRSWTRSSIRGIALLALPITVGAATIAGPLVTTLYGEAFAPATTMFMIICWDVPLLLFTALCGNITAAVGLERPAARIYLLCAVLNIVLNLLLIPMFGGAGASAVTVITDGLSTLLFFRLLDRQMEISRVTPVLARITLGAIIMGGIVWLYHSLPLPAMIAVGAASYAIMVFLMRLVDPELLTSLRGLIRKRYARRAPAT